MFQASEIHCRSQTRRTRYVILIVCQFGTVLSSSVQWAWQLPFIAHAFVDLLVCVTLTARLLKMHTGLRKYYSSRFDTNSIIQDAYHLRIITAQTLSFVS